MDFEDDDDEPAGRTAEELIQLVRAQSALLVAVATGGPRIDEVDPQYQRRRRTLRTGLARLGLKDPFPWRSLWDWYGHWSADLPGYGPRRAYISKLAGPVIDELDRLANPSELDDWEATPTDEPSVEDRIAGMKQRLHTAQTLDDLQDVGRRAREILIDLSRAVYTPEMTPTGELVPGLSDVKLRLEHYFAARFPGGNESELRALVRSAVGLAHAVTHKGSTAHAHALAVAQATILIVRTVQRAEQELEDE